MIDRKEHEFASTSNATCESVLTVIEILLKKLCFVVWIKKKYQFHFYKSISEPVRRLDKPDQTVVLKKLL